MSPRPIPKVALAFGQADQAVFRATKDLVDWIQVPGTVATYFREATGGFVLSLGRPYVLDPRTPMLQYGIPAPEVRASHRTLAAQYGPAFLARVEANAGPPTDDEWIAGSRAIAVFQRDYVQTSAAKMAKYAKLEGKEAPAAPGHPKFLLPAYLMVEGPDDPNWALTLAMLDAARDEVPDRPFAAVAALRSEESDAPDFTALHAMLADLAAARIEHAFVWLNDFNEREAEPTVLVELEKVLAASEIPNLYNMYGGYFSLAVGGFGAVTSGVGYSELRRADVLFSTGAAPARYYHPALHAFMNQDLAARFVQTGGDSLLCSCPICSPKRSAGLSALTFTELMTHFVYVRASEKQLATGSRIEIADALDETAAIAATVAKKLPGRLGMQVRHAHLLNWSAALRSLG